MTELRRLFTPSPATPTVDVVKKINGNKPKMDHFTSIEKAARQYLQDTSDTFPLDDVAAQVFNQVTNC